MQLSANDAFNNLLANAGNKYPDRSDHRFRKGTLLPLIKPKFTFAIPCTVFTIGSCFAREIECSLAKVGCELPTRSFISPRTEWPHGPQGLLNEYNPGRIAQRIVSAFSQEISPDATIVPYQSGYIDLLLPGGNPVTYERAKERRRQIDQIYHSLPTSDLVIITLGFIEAWYDNLTGSYLNRFPPRQAIAAQPDRFVFRRLSLDQSLALLEQAISAIIGHGINKIILTVSPVPLEATFTNLDAIIANSFSKSTLRVCAESLANNHPQVDYFPSYDIISGCGLAALEKDNRHVKFPVVDTVIRTMLNAYSPSANLKFPKTMLEKFYRVSASLPRRALGLLARRVSSR